MLVKSLENEIKVIFIKYHKRMIAPADAATTHKGSFDRRHFKGTCRVLSNLESGSDWMQKVAEVLKPASAYATHG